MKKTFLVPFIIFILLVVAFFVQLQRNSEGDDPKYLESALIGKQIPIKTASDLLQPNLQHDIQLFQQKRPLLVNVWATWCPTCYAEHQYLNKLKQQGVTIIGINYKDDRQKAIKWLKQLGNPYQVVINDPKGALGLDLGVYGAPETFLVDGNGIIHYRLAGDLNDEVWQKTIYPLYQQLMTAK